MNVNQNRSREKYLRKISRCIRLLRACLLRRKLLINVPHVYFREKRNQRFEQKSNRIVLNRTVFFLNANATIFPNEIGRRAVYSNSKAARKRVRNVMVDRARHTNRSESKTIQTRNSFVVVTPAAPVQLFIPFAVALLPRALAPAPRTIRGTRTRFHTAAPANFIFYLL